MSKTFEIFGQGDKTYHARYELRDLGQLVTSHTITGGINPNYPQRYQGRKRENAATKVQIDTIIRNFCAKKLVAHIPLIEQGTPIINEEGQVLSGNGRCLVYENLVQFHPAKWQAYQDELMASLRNFTSLELIPAGQEGKKFDVRNYQHPVLVRVLVGEVDLVKFCQEANGNDKLEMSITEIARQFAEYISYEHLINLEVEGDSLDEVLQLQKNRFFLESFLARLPASEIGKVSDGAGHLSQEGLLILKAAMVDSVFGDSWFVSLVFEQTDNEVKSITNAIMAALPKLAIAESQVKNGDRSSDLGLAQDLVKVLKRIIEIKRSGQKVWEYLLQKEFDPQLTEYQREILLNLYNRKEKDIKEKGGIVIGQRISFDLKSTKQLKESFELWAALVLRQPHPSEISFLTGMTDAKGQLIKEWLLANNPDALKLSYSEKVIEVWQQVEQVSHAISAKMPKTDNKPKQNNLFGFIVNEQAVTVKPTARPVEQVRPTAKPIELGQPKCFGINESGHIQLVRPTVKPTCQVVNQTPTVIDQTTDNLILQALNGKGATLEEITNLVPLPASEVMIGLTMLELGGQVIKNGMSYFRRVIGSGDYGIPGYKESKRKAKVPKPKAESPKPSPAPRPPAPEGVIEHITRKGKTIYGVIRPDLTLQQAKAIDPFTFIKDNGWFIREEHLEKLPPLATTPAPKVEPPAPIPAPVVKPAPKVEPPAPVWIPRSKTGRNFKFQLI